VLLLFAGAIYALNSGAAALGWPLLVVAIVLALLWAAASSALGSIYLSALYQFAAYDRVPGGFDAATLRGAFTSKQTA
jgi:hypothetical protein